MRRVGLSVHQLSLLRATTTELSREAIALGYRGMFCMLAIIITATFRGLVYGLKEAGKCPVKGCPPAAEKPT
jgi:hypothetical protein